MSSSSLTPLLIEGPKESITPIGTADAAAETAAAEPAGRFAFGWPLTVAAAVALTVGLIAGGGATAYLVHEPAQPLVAANVQSTRALQASVAQLGSELATLKAGIASAQRSSTAQFGKLADRLDRSEKAQAEPAAKLAKLQDSVDRIEQKQQAAVAAAARSDVTGSIASAKDVSKTAVAEGWRLRDFYAGRAVVESRNGTLFEVGPGSNLPGLGKVETVKRENGRVVVATKNGVIAGSFEQPRRPAYMPYRYD